MESGLATASGAELVMIRHAPAATGGRLCGRTDVPLEAGGLTAAAGLGAALAVVERRVSSPALRCRQTAAALWPDATVETDPCLWEQDFGAWEGLEFSALPDLGTLAAAELARHRPPGGESFEDVCARVGPALVALVKGEGAVAVVAHAGTVRAALALALGPAAALGFEVAPLSVTRLRPVPGGFAVIGPDRRPA
jgi:alpha-ribazole phosphatase